MDATYLRLHQLLTRPVIDTVTYYHDKHRLIAVNPNTRDRNCCCHDNCRCARKKPDIVYEDKPVFSATLFESHKPDQTDWIGFLHYSNIHNFIYRVWIYPKYIELRLVCNARDCFRDNEDDEQDDDYEEAIVETMTIECTVTRDDRQIIDWSFKHMIYQGEIYEPEETRVRYYRYDVHEPRRWQWDLVCRLLDERKYEDPDTSYMIHDVLKWSRGAPDWNSALSDYDDDDININIQAIPHYGNEPDPDPESDID